MKRQGKKNNDKKYCSKIIKLWKNKDTYKEDDKSTFSIRLSKSVQFEIKCAAKASGCNISQYIKNIHDESVKKKNYFLLRYAHDKNNDAELLKLAFLFPVDGLHNVLSSTQKKEIKFMRSYSELWVDPKKDSSLSLDDNIPIMSKIMNNYKRIRKFVTKNERPIKGWLEPREAVYGKEPKNEDMHDEQEVNEFKLRHIIPSHYENLIDKKYIEIFKILKKLKQTEPSSQSLDELDQEYGQAISELDKLFDKVSQIAKGHNPDETKD